MKLKILTDGQTYTFGKLSTGADNNKYKFSLQPMNEDHELDYVEPFTGTPDEMIAKCRTLIKGLKEVLVHGTFTIKVFSEFYDNEWTVDSEHILDQEYNIIQ